MFDLLVAGMYLVEFVLILAQYQDGFYRNCHIIGNNLHFIPAVT